MFPSALHGVKAARSAIGRGPTALVARVELRQQRSTKLPWSVRDQPHHQTVLHHINITSMIKYVPGEPHETPSNPRPRYEQRPVNRGGSLAVGVFAVRRPQSREGAARLMTVPAALYDER